MSPNENDHGHQKNNDEPIKPQTTQRPDPSDGAIIRRSYDSEELGTKVDVDRFPKNNDWPKE